MTHGRVHFASRSGIKSAFIILHKWMHETRAYVSYVYVCVGIFQNHTKKEDQDQLSLSHH